MQPIFDAPMAARGFGGFFGRKIRPGDAVARLDAAAVGQFGPRGDLDDAGGVRQSQLAGKAAVAVEPIGLTDHADNAPLDAGPWPSS